MKKNIFKLSIGVALLSMAFVSCSEDIDESARYTFVDETVTDYLRNNPQFSVYASILNEVPISSMKKDGSISKMSQLLSARGNFMLFAPTNDAIVRYLETVKAKGILDPSVQTLGDIADANIADSLKKVIVYNSIVDFSEFKSDFQYMSDIEPTGGKNSQTMVYSNMNNRYLTVFPIGKYKMALNGDTINIDSYSIEGAHTYKYDTKVYNGIIHEMYEVVAPSNDDILDVLGKSSSVSEFSYMLSLCGLNDLLSKQEDEVYHEKYWENMTEFAPPVHATQGSNMKPFEQRLIGYTAFLETNDVYRDMGVLDANGKIDLDLLREYLADKQYMPGGVNDKPDQGTNYTDSTNWLNYYITYHLLPMSIDYDYLVIHYNENGYRWDNKDCRPTIVQTEHYTTMGVRRLLNISEGSDTVSLGTQGKRLNYFAKTYRSNTDPLTVQELYNQGILVTDTLINSTDIETPVNAKIYPIKEPLIYTQQIAQWQGNMRMRIDVASLFPELMSNRIRRRYNNIGDYGFPVYSKYAYLENMKWTDESNVYYFPGYASQWHNYQGDEFNITGVYEVTIKMPPIPYRSTYELRIGVSINPCRGMMQVYFGEDPESPPAAGIPLDMRLGGVMRYTQWTGSGAPVPSNIGWEEDGEDQVTNDEIDKKMRLQGFMKAPAGFSKSPIATQIDVANSMRNNCESYGAKGNCLRRIITRQVMEPGKTYYVKFKDVLGNPNSQFFLDYFELVPKEVYDNPVNPEDIW